jgi:hypothetical protein
MRVENPMKLAEVILAYDKGWSRGRIDQILAGGTTTDVTLDKKVNVHITYFTATADSDGKVHGHSDVYGMDSRLASALAGRSVVLSSAHASQDVAPEAAETRPATPRKAASKPARRPASTAKAAPAPRPWNPFPTQFGN